MEKRETVSGGIGFIDLLQIVFIVLKLVGVLTWKWVWVLSPIWIPLSLGIIILIIYAIVVFIGDNHDNTF